MGKWKQFRDRVFLPGLVTRCKKEPGPRLDLFMDTPESGVRDFPINLNLRRSFVLAHNRAFHLPKQFRNDAGER